MIVETARALRAALSRAKHDPAHHAHAMMLAERFRSEAAAIDPALGTAALWVAYWLRLPWGGTDLATHALDQAERAIASAPPREAPPAARVIRARPYLAVIEGGVAA